MFLCTACATGSYQLSAIGYRLSAISYQLSAISYQLSAISYLLSAIGHQSTDGGGETVVPRHDKADRQLPKADS
jgi:hypothetical protein